MSYKKGKNVTVWGIVGDDTVLGDRVYVAGGAHVGSNVTIGNNTTIDTIKIGDNSTICKNATINFNVPADSVVEFTQAFGNRYRTYVVWTPDGIFIKPGCKPLEPILETRARLKRIALTGRGWQYMQREEAKREAAEMLEWLDYVEGFEAVLV